MCVSGDKLAALNHSEMEQPRRSQKQSKERRQWKGVEERRRRQAVLEAFPRSHLQQQAPTAKKLRPPYESRRSRKALVRQPVHDWPRIQWIGSLCRAEGPPEWGIQEPQQPQCRTTPLPRLPNINQHQGTWGPPRSILRRLPKFQLHIPCRDIRTAEYKIQHAAETRDAAFPRRKINTGVCR